MPQPSAKADGNKKSYRIILTATEADGKRRVAATGLTATESYLEYVLPLPSASADGLGTPPLFLGTLVPGRERG
ncbi:MAG: hypothetical protein RBS38_10795 [Bacteroidales bacterium]|nr:hypothetical protein [Bacteroidales bacterium]